jgi:type VI protein secretion system component Hcp
MASSQGISAVYLSIPWAKGSVTQAGYEGWIRLTGLSFNLEGKFSMEDVENVDQSDDFGQVVKVSGVQLEKHLDDASGDFLRKSVEPGEQEGADFRIVLLSLHGSRDGQPALQAEYILKKAVIEKFDVDASGGECVEKLSVAFNSMDANFHNYDVKGKPTNTIRLSCDVDCKK